MDGITEPVVLVLGHPIAGNPAQFALERAFASLDLQWRVLSCDVSPDQVADAIAGADVLGFRGLLLDRNLVDATPGGESPRDLYWRLPDTHDAWQAEDVLAIWLRQMIRDHFDELKKPVGPLLWIGDPNPSFPSEIASEQSQSPIAWASAESIEHADLIAISKSIVVAEWPVCNDSTLVIDFANPPNDADQIRSLGYRVLSREEERIGVLTESFYRWTGQRPGIDVLTDAIEEYLAV
ncbi:hypothetical protein NHH03_20405 [Stieleria sp. TO1_6]|uniref:hypothetical protein n=1 Tax=Stieleria tagensis TaxID=2956795 RepID=UPI00209BA695|nr:hypothetical protein [Stieleria tagensis]MCO8124118.1 hypothetical protein [Stieleria tagensis]